MAKTKPKTKNVVNRDAGKHNMRHLFRLDGDIGVCKYCNITVAEWDWETPCKK